MKDLKELVRYFIYILKLFRSSLSLQKSDYKIFFLFRHFRKCHFLCEHPDCVDNPLVSVFKTELDLKIHISEKVQF